MSQYSISKIVLHLNQNKDKNNMVLTFFRTRNNHVAWQCEFDNSFDFVIHYLNKNFDTLIDKNENQFNIFANINSCNECKKWIDIDNRLQMIEEDLLDRRYKKFSKKFDYETFKQFIDLVFVDNTCHLNITQKITAYFISNRLMNQSEKNDYLSYNIITQLVSPLYFNFGGIKDFGEELLYYDPELKSATVDNIKFEDIFIKDIFKIVCKRIAKNNYDCLMNKKIETISLSEILMLLLSEMIERNVTIKICPNCGKYFLPSRSDTVYCNNISPQNESKNCQEYKKYMNYLEKTQKDESKKIYKQIYNIKTNKIKRCGGENNTLKNDLNDFMEKAQQWKADVRSEIKTEEEFVAWLKSVKGKKCLD